MEADELFDLVEVRSLGAEGEVLDANLLADLFEELRGEGLRLRRAE